MVPNCFKFYSLREAAALFGAKTNSPKKYIKKNDYVLNTEKLENKLNVLFLKPKIEDGIAVCVEQKRQLFRGRFNISRVLEREKAIGLAILQKEKEKAIYDGLAKTISYITYDLIKRIDVESASKSKKYDKDSGLTLEKVIKNYKSYEILKE